MAQNSTVPAKYISEVIGEDYKKWGPGTMVFIPTPTGSGKSHFILHTLLQHALTSNPFMRILYMVNRKTLKDQIETERLDIQADYDRQHWNLNVSYFFRVETYQTVENKIKANDFSWLNTLGYYQIIVYDECHYFLCDSTFNPDVDLSYSYLTAAFDKKVQIFMSATMGDLKKYVTAKFDDLATYFNTEPDFSLKFHRRNRNFIFDNYTIPPDYSYVDLHSFREASDIPGIIKEADKKSKWLIFVDDNSVGKSLMRTIISEGIEDEDGVVFLNAQYKANKSAYESIQQLTTQSFISKRIVISTSVLDNGVSFHDYSLRNIVILTDTQEQFIQMLGRKRNDGEKVHLYICKRSAKYFESRLGNMTKLYAFAEKQKTQLPYVQFVAPNLPGQPQSFYSSSSNPFGQHNILNKLLKSESTRRQLSQFCYTYYGLLYLSIFSVGRAAELKQYYKKMISDLEDDENAFLNTQAKWLGIDADVAACFWDKDRENRISELKDIVIQIIESNVGKELTKDGTVELKRALRDSLPELLDILLTDAENNSVLDDVELYNGFDNDYNSQDESDEDVPNSIAQKLSDNGNPTSKSIVTHADIRNIQYQKDTPLTDKRFNKITKFLNIPYRMKKVKQKYVIKKLDMDENQQDISSDCED